MTDHLEAELDQDRKSSGFFCNGKVASTNVFDSILAFCSLHLSTESHRQSDSSLSSDCFSGGGAGVAAHPPDWQLAQLGTGISEYSCFWQRLLHES